MDSSNCPDFEKNSNIARLDLTNPVESIKWSYSVKWHEETNDASDRMHMCRK